MRRRIVTLLVLLIPLTACVESPQVVEGKVTAVDTSANMVTMVDSTAPDRAVTLSLEGADIGVPPEVGDTVRVAYLQREDGPRALRVMNVSRQEEQTGAKH